MWETAKWGRLGFDPVAAMGYRMFSMYLVVDSWARSLGGPPSRVADSYLTVKGEGLLT